MRQSNALERCVGFINSQMQPASRLRSRPGAQHPPVVTISRQAGAGAWVVAEELVTTLQAEDPHGAPWTVFDRNLVGKVLEDHELPKRLAQFLSEDRVSEISDTVDGLFGLRPSSWSLVRDTADTILHLAELGNVVMIGRGANVITGKLPYAFHVRLVGSVPRRERHVEELLHIGPKEAAAYVHDEDLGRARYLKKYYDTDIDDPLQYDLIVNTDRVPYAEAARLIADAVSARADGDMAASRSRAPSTMPRVSVPT